MTVHWYAKAVVYSLDIETFQDADNDGVGDIRGLINRLDYLARLGITCIWLSPLHPSPGRDDGYDVTDFYNVDPRLGSLGDFTELVHEAGERGIRVMIDLVINHTSDEHPWFQSARSSPDSPYRDWFIWSESEPPDRYQGAVFPGEQKETWTYDETAGAWYYHRFYDFQPDLNYANPAVREEAKKIMAFWTRLGVSGFRVDAAPFIIELTEPGNPNSPKDFDLLTELRLHLSWRQGDAIFLAEANVEPSELIKYFCDDAEVPIRLHMLFDFMLNGRIMLALARGDSEPIIDSLRDTPRLPDACQWATFLRNHDEVDLSRLTAEQRNDVFAEFGPEERMQLYGRGIRRRLAPMLGNDRKRIELAYSLQFSLRGTPVLRYGDEIGMGDLLTLPGRNAIRTPMQWSARPNAGFSSAPKDKLVRPVVEDDEYGYQRVNVVTQRQDPTSLLSWFERMIRTLRECPEVGAGECTPIDTPMPRQVLAHRATSPIGSTVFVHNLGSDDVTVDLSTVDGDLADPIELLADRDYERIDPKSLDAVALGGYGYRWIRLRGDT